MRAASLVMMRPTWAFMMAWRGGRRAVLMSTTSSFVAEGPVEFSAVGDARVGEYAVPMSQSRGTRRYAGVESLGTRATPAPQEDVWVRGRVATIRAKGNSCFIVVRSLGDPTETVQACYFKDKQDRERSTEMIKWLGRLAVESVVDVAGTLVEAEVKSCSRSNVEILVDRVFVVSPAPRQLPFLVEDAARTRAEIEASMGSDRPFAAVGQEARLDYRWLDLRTPATAATAKLQAAVCRLFRRTLEDEGFVEIHTPKLVGGESESGAGVFTTDYFGQKACLAQSPQLYKQLAVAGDLGRVFEVGPVFRAENSNTRRHLCEFTGLDFEMAIDEHYLEAVEVGYAVFKRIFDGLEREKGKELAAVRAHTHAPPVEAPDTPVVIHFQDAVAMLEAAGDRVDGDLSGANERNLGEIVKARFGADLFVVDRYPAALRPFYTMPCPDDPTYSNSYDFFLRGQEICSGAQRCHDPQILRDRLKQANIDLDDLSPSLTSYILAFDHGAPPHAGCGFGLERTYNKYKPNQTRPGGDMTEALRAAEEGVEHVLALLKGGRLDAVEAREPLVRLLGLCDAVRAQLDRPAAVTEDEEDTTIAALLLDDDDDDESEPKRRRSDGVVTPVQPIPRKRTGGFSEDEAVAQIKKMCVSREAKRRRGRDDEPVGKCQKLPEEDTDDERRQDDQKRPPRRLDSDETAPRDADSDDDDSEAEAEDETTESSPAPPKPSSSSRAFGALSLLPAEVTLSVLSKLNGAELGRLECSCRAARGSPGLVEIAVLHVKRHQYGVQNLPLLRRENWPFLVNRWEWTRSSKSVSTRTDEVAAALQSLDIFNYRSP
ncbi:hypothetical protein CTAYLR_001115 [Chrysophaeum taylorii]|uniref:aspartate--tRNA ligase n=1 Tax=Chrysophaeum taylorii TaxID=2483200 RepID=A0AAD7UP03_9STRA|nr:hypothetical protein CTAYLR_001115 [Chrysophaeum taylorii]